MEDLLRVISTPDKGTEGEQGIFDSEEEGSEDEAEADEDEDEDGSEAAGDEEDGVAAIDAATAAARPAGAPADEVMRTKCQWKPSQQLGRLSALAAGPVSFTSGCI